MKSITSADNLLYKSHKALGAAKGRKEQGLFIAEGPHLAQEALMADAGIRYIAVRSGAEEKFNVLIEKAEGLGAEALSLSPRLFDALAGTETPQGILAIVAIRKSDIDAFASLDRGMAILLERVQDPGNLGTILRTALAVGARFAVITGDSADPWSQKVVRSSQGAVLRLPIVEVDGAAEAVTVLNANGWRTACGCMDGVNFFDRAPHAKTAVVIGNEAAGVSAVTMAACSAQYTLPMPGGAESLNAAVAAGIMLYDIWREQKSPQ